jgi:hypothetical protein
MGLPVWSMLPVVENLADEMEILVFFMSRIFRGSDYFSLFQ